VEKLSDKIVACQKNSIELKAKSEWINEHLKNHPSDISWWQEPHAVIGGIIVSASVASAVSMYLTWRATKD